jgi:hypothetical protein
MILDNIATNECLIFNADFYLSTCIFTVLVPVYKQAPVLMS